jgi:hypothetical protein
MKSAIGVRPSTASSSLAFPATRRDGPRAASLRTRIARQLRQTVPVTRHGRQVKMPKAELIAHQIVDAAAKGNLKAALWTVQVDDEASIAASNSSTQETFELPNRENLRFIANRLSGLLAEGQ